MQFKYVIFDDVFVVLIPMETGLKHSEVSAGDAKPTSAGFVKFEDGNVEVFGHSESLNLSPGKHDSFMIQHVMG